VDRLSGRGRRGAAAARGRARARAVLLVVDAAGAPAHLAAAGEALCDLYTDAGVARGCPAVLVVAARADAPGARAPPALRAALAAELGRLGASRRALRVADGADGADAPRELPGRLGADFDFADAPLATSWAAATAAAGETAAVAAFLDTL